MNSDLHLVLAPHAWGVQAFVLVQLFVCCSNHVEAQFRYEQTAAIGLSGAATGTSPYAKLIEGPNGALYGTTRFGGSSFNDGSIYRVNMDGTGFRVLHIFGILPGDASNPTYDGIMFGTNGLIYGVSHTGGLYGRGAIFSIDLNGDQYKVRHSFTDDRHRPRGQLLVLDDGSLLGATWGGYIYQINHDGSGFRLLHWAGTTNENGLAYNAGFIKGSDGWLYNMTEDGGYKNPDPHATDPWPTYGTVVRIRADGTGYEILYRFQSSRVGDGSYPHGTLLEASDGVLYGLTVHGGYPDSFNVEGFTAGTIFRINRDGSDYRQLHRFAHDQVIDGGPYGQLIEGSDERLYGHTPREVYKIHRDGSGFTIIDTNETEGINYVNPGLIEASDGRLYRPTSLGVIGINKDGTGRQILCRFRTDLSEQTTRAPLFSYQGRLFGTSELGGTGTNGTVFVLNSDATSLKVISMLGTNTATGKMPNGIAAGTNGFLYGTTQIGGSNNAGVVFRIADNGSGYTNLHYFGGTGDGRSPRVALVSGQDGYLYGCAYVSGAFGRGSIFRIREDGAHYGILRHLGATTPDGLALNSALTLGPDDALYGVTSGGGASNRGTLFRISKTGNDYAILHHFGGNSDGASPRTPLLLASSGYFYGATLSGGDGFGTIYRLRPDGGEYHVVYRFTDRSRGIQPRGPMVESPRGVLWACGGGGTYDAGVIFRARLDGLDCRTMWHFGGAPNDGAAPESGLTLTETGWVAGTTSEGGDLGWGSIFRFDPNATVLDMRVTGSMAILNWNGAGGEVESAVPGTPIWEPQPADIVVNGNETSAVIPLGTSDRIFRVKR